MSMLSRLLKTDATFWSEVSRDRYGDPTMAAPVPITCFWEDTIELFVDKKGDQSQSHSVVWTETAVTVGGFLYRGTSVSTNPETVTGADMIRRVDLVDGVDGREALYKAYL